MTSNAFTRCSAAARVAESDDRSEERVSSSALRIAAVAVIAAGRRAASERPAGEREHASSGPADGAAAAHLTHGMAKRSAQSQDPADRVSWKEKKKKQKERKDRKSEREAERLLSERLKSVSPDQPLAKHLIGTGLLTTDAAEVPSLPANASLTTDQVTASSESASPCTRGRDWTVSIALPASIADNAQSAELRTYLAGQIARAAVIFNIDEIVLYDEYCVTDPLDEKRKCMSFMGKILQYLECPQYLRKYLFPIQKDLQYAGLLNPLDCQHHLKTTDLTVPFREGVVLNKKVSAGDPSRGSSVYIGLDQEVQIDRVIVPGVRLTVEFDPLQLQPSSSKDHVINVKKRKNIRGKAVPPADPRTRLGLYWGYTVRIADSLSHALRDCPFPGGYDLTLGTSERGDVVDDVRDAFPQSFKHAIIFFGGLKGIEAAVDSDVRLSDVADPRSLFHFYLNTCPDQGSNTIRTEEAILITLSCLKSFLNQKE